MLPSSNPRRDGGRVDAVWGRLRRPGAICSHLVVLCYNHGNACAALVEVICASLPTSTCVNYACAVLMPCSPSSSYYATIMGTLAPSWCPRHDPSCVPPRVGTGAVWMRCGGACAVLAHRGLRNRSIAKPPLSTVFCWRNVLYYLLLCCIGHIHVTIASR